MPEPLLFKTEVHISEWEREKATCTHKFVFTGKITNQCDVSDVTHPYPRLQSTFCLFYNTAIHWGKRQAQ